MKLRALLSIFLLLSQPFLALAQQPATEPPSTVIRVTTHAVLVDVSVTDKAGNPITDLKPENFVLKENGKQQQISSFRLESRGTKPAKANLPPGVFSNRPEYKVANGAKTILLLDALNTTLANQAFVRQQMLLYVKNQIQPGQETAVYALTNHLLRLQDYTDDSSALLKAIDEFTARTVPGQPSDIRAQNNPGRQIVNSKSGLENIGTIPLGTFVADASPVELSSRIEETLAGMRELARINGGLPGRKNLIWVSAGFPIAFSPDEGTTITAGMVERTTCITCPPPLPNEMQAQGLSVNTVGKYLDEIHRASAAITAAQMSLYPVDARGLFTLGANSAAQRTGINANGAAMSGQEFANTLTNSVAGIVSTQDNMKEIARQTGGQAYYNRNDIDHAVALASADGGTYYSISYSSTNKKFDGGYRTIKVEVNRPGLNVRYRNGYFAYDPSKDMKGKGKADATTSLKDLVGDSSIVAFDALVQAQPVKGDKAPVPVRFRIDPKTVSWGDSSDKHDLDIDCYVMAIDKDSKIAANTGKTLTMPLEPAQFDQVQKNGLLVPVDIELAPGDYTVKLAVRDNRSGLVGNLTVPLKVAR